MPEHAGVDDEIQITDLRDSLRFVFISMIVGSQIVLKLYPVKATNGILRSGFHKKMLLRDGNAIEIEPLATGISEGFREIQTHPRQLR